MYVAFSSAHIRAQIEAFITTLCRKVAGMASNVQRVKLLCVCFSRNPITGVPGGGSNNGCCLCVARGVHSFVDHSFLGTDIVAGGSAGQGLVAL